MKKLVFVILILSCIHMKVNSQNRIHSWDLSAISSIKIEIQNEESKIEVKVYNDQKVINQIMAFFLDVDFRNYEESKINLKEKDVWLYRLTFKGQRDQIYLFDDYAFIGKSIYMIDDKTVWDFKELIKKL